MYVGVSRLSPARSRQERGMALLATMMVMALLSALMIGFMSTIVADQNASSLNRDQTQAYAAAHAGLEKLTSDLMTLFVSDVSPETAEITAATTGANIPHVPHFQFLAPDGSVGYTARPRFLDGNGNPAPESMAGSDITNGPYQGLKGIITPYEIMVTSRSAGGAEVRLRRELQTVAVPVFQFGMFSETDLAFHAGDAFTFGGRVHTNRNLYLAAAGGTLQIGDRITAVGEVIRTHLPNGLETTAATGYNGTVSIIKSAGTFRNLARTEGSLVQTVGSAQNEPIWTNTSIGAYNSYIRNGRTGARRLELPLVADGNGDGQPDAQPIEVIRRPDPANPDTALVFGQRFFSLASVRILLSDTAADITGLPTVTGDAPYNLTAAEGRYVPLLLQPPFAASAGPAAQGAVAANVYKSPAGTPLLDGFIKIELQRQNGTWLDVTGEILGLGIAGRNLADSDEAVATRWNNVPDGAGDTCGEPNPNAIIRLQRVRDIPVSLPPCGMTVVGGVVTAVSLDNRDYWPNALYDTREGQFRDGINGPISLGGLMHYVELDANNLRRWLTGAIGANGTQAKNENGFIVYFSDRRNNRNLVNAETGEYGFEDVVNMPNHNAPNGVMDVAAGVRVEDFNGNTTLETYGALPRNVPAGALAPFDLLATPVTAVPAVGGAANQSAAMVARSNRIVHFRRALKVVNGGQGNIVGPGLTIASENPLYLQGNWNATTASANVNPHVATAMIADAVTFLSNSWNDIRSFTSPGDSNNRQASTTSYRVGVITGKGIAFPRPNWADASFGSDGGAHNFVRLLEDWPQNNAIFRYRGSFASLYYNRQGTGSFKCCDGNTYIRNTRDWFFDTDFLVPALLPPGTPMFRDVNTLTFRQLLRPTQ
jgi:hypothetical protein